MAEERVEERTRVVVIAFIEEVAEVHTGAEMALAGTCNNIDITSHSHVLFSESCLVLFCFVGNLDA